MPAPEESVQLLPDSNLNTQKLGNRVVLFFRIRSWLLGARFGGGCYTIATVAAGGDGDTGYCTGKDRRAQCSNGRNVILRNCKRSGRQLERG